MFQGYCRESGIAIFARRGTRIHVHSHFKERVRTKFCELFNQWPNLKNLSGGLNLSHGLNMVSST